MQALDQLAQQIDPLIDDDPERAAIVYETFLAGCYAKTTNPEQIEKVASQQIASEPLFAESYPRSCSPNSSWPRRTR